MGASSTILGDVLGDILGDSLGDAFGSNILLKWSDGTFANASTRYIWDVSGKVLYGSFAGGVPAVAFIDGQARLQMEGARTNRIDALSAWTVRGIVTRTSGQTDPSGGTGAYLIEGLGNGGANDFFSAVVAGTISQAIGVGMFVKRVDSSSVWELRQRATPVSGQWAVDSSLLSAGWERITADHPAVTVTNAFVNSIAGTSSFTMNDAGQDTDVTVWMPQMPDEPFLSSPILEATTRAADSMSFTADQVPDVMRSGAFSVEVTTEFEGGDLANSDQHMVVWLDSSNFLCIEKTAGAVYQVRFATTSGDVTRTITNSRNQTLTLTVDFANGKLTVSGATTGDGTASGTVSDWPLSTTHFGSTSVPGDSFFGLIGEPTPSVVTTTTGETVLGSNLAFGVDVDNRVMGTYPDITTLTDAFGPDNASPTQGTSTVRPHLVYVRDRTNASFSGANYLQDTPTANIWAAGESEVNVWTVLKWDDPSALDFAWDFSLGSTISTGINIRTLSATSIACSVFAGGTLGILTVTHANLNQLQMYRIHYDGSNISLYANGALIGSTAKTGTMTNACTRVTLGAQGSLGGAIFAGDIRSLWLSTGALSADQVTDMDNFVLADAGMDLSHSGGTAILNGSGRVGLVVSDREMEDATEVGVLTLYDRIKTIAGVDTTQALTTRQPTLVAVDPQGTGTATNYASYDGTEYLLKGSISPALWTNSETEVNVWCAGRWNDPETDLSGSLLSIGTGFSVNSGVNIELIGTRTVRATVDAGGGTAITVNVVTTPDQYHMYRVHFDGSKVDLYVDGQLEGSTAVSGSMDAAAQHIVLAGDNLASNQGNVELRSLWIATGVLSTHQVLDMDGFVLEDAGIAHPHNGGSLPLLSGEIAHWRADAQFITLNVADVSQWDDIDLGHDLVQATGSAQPAYNAVQINSHPTVQLGAGEYMTTPDAADLDFGQGTFVVQTLIKRAHYSSAFYQCVWSKGTALSADNLRGFIDAANNLILYWGNNSQRYDFSGVTVLNDTPCVATWGVDSSTNEVIYGINGSITRFPITLSGTGSNSLPFRVHGDGTAGTEQDVPNMAEMVVWNRGAGASFTDEELQSLYTEYWQPRYNL